jgi:hypothetical protein
LAFECRQCGAQYDPALFAFGRMLKCDCGGDLGMKQGHERWDIDERLREWLRRFHSPMTLLELRVRIAHAKKKDVGMDQILREVAPPIDFALKGRDEFVRLFMAYWDLVPPA